MPLMHNAQGDVLVRCEGCEHFVEAPLSSCREDAIQAAARQGWTTFQRDSGVWQFHCLTCWREEFRKLFVFFVKNP
jgi:hypothetical protein